MANPPVTVAAVRAEAEKLLPHPAIRTAPRATTLVNIETVLWIDTTPRLDLGTVTLLGHHVHIRAHLHRTHWNFGDHTSATRNDPGRPYDPADACKTRQCPQYWGHTYRHTGVRQLRAQTIWTGQFRVDGGRWRDITGTVTVPTTTTTLHIRQARAILTSNP